MSSTLFLVQALNGLQLGVLLFLIAAGLTLVFGVMDFINLAHGVQYMLGAYLAVAFYGVFDNFLVALVLALLAALAFGLLLEFLVFRHLYARDHLDQVIATFGIILFLNHAVRLVWGAAPLTLPVPEFFTGSISLMAGLHYPVWRLRPALPPGIVYQDRHAGACRLDQRRNGLGARRQHRAAFHVRLRLRQYACRLCRHHDRANHFGRTRHGDQHPHSRVRSDCYRRHRLNSGCVRRSVADRPGRYVGAFVFGRYSASLHGPLAGAYGRPGTGLDADLCADGDCTLRAAVRAISSERPLMASTLAAEAADPEPPRTRRIILPAAIFLILALLPIPAALTHQRYLVDLATRVMVYAVAAVALDLLVGCGGLISFGHAAFIGIGAYAVGILSAHGIGDALVALPTAIIAAMLFAWLTGIVCLRTKGVYFIMITLAFGQMIFFVATSLAPYGGDNGLTIAARNTIAGVASLKSDRAFYYFTLICLLATYLFCRALVASRFGRVLRGGKENTTRMATIGFTIRRFQLVAYIITGGLGGLSGFLLANSAEFVSPAYMSWQQSGELIVMVILGGLGTLHGAIIGTAVYLVVEEWLSGVTENWQVIFGPLLVLAVLFARGGLLGM